MLVLVGGAEDTHKRLIVSILGVLLKFGRVKKTTPDALLSYTSRCAQDDCDCQPQSNGDWEW